MYPKWHVNLCREQRLTFLKNVINNFSPPANGPKDPWPRVLSLPGAQGGLLETPPRRHATIYLFWNSSRSQACWQARRILIRNLARGHDIITKDRAHPRRLQQEASDSLDQGRAAYPDDNPTQLMKICSSRPDLKQSKLYIHY